jgi:hypothetical protein
MENQDFRNPSKLFVAFLDSFNQPMWIIDKSGNILMNEQAKEYSKMGFDILSNAKDLSLTCSKTIIHFGKQFKLFKKDINHGTNSCVFTLEPDEDPIRRLKESSRKLKNVLRTI